jgi:uncharacterized protein (DUF488 family)
MRYCAGSGNASHLRQLNLGGYGAQTNDDVDSLPGKITTRKPDMARKAKLFTIGYEQTPPKAVLDELEQAGVKLLVDVRAVTSSRRPGFSKNQLAAGLDERGIAYIHLAALGTPKEGRLAARSGNFARLHQIFSKHLKTAQAKEELDELSALVKKAGPVCLLCYERDHTHCHRQMIAEIIEERNGVKVENLAGKQV